VSLATVALATVAVALVAVVVCAYAAYVIVAAGVVDIAVRAVGELSVTAAIEAISMAVSTYLSYFTAHGH
jgi:hypothetical protein